MSLLQAIRVSRAPLAGLGAVGVYWGGFAALVPDITAMAGASDSEFGLVLILSAVGGMVSMYLAPQVGAALKRHLLPVSAVLVALACLLPLLAHSVIVLGAVLFLMGAAVSMLDIGTNVRVSVLENRHGLPLMNLNHAMFAFAFAATAFLTALAREAGYGPALVMPVMAVVCLILGAVMVEGSGWQDAAVSAEAGHGAAPWRIIIAIGAIMFAAFVGENATSVWSALHIERTLHVAAGFGSYGPAMLGLTMGIGRMSGQMVAARLGDARLIVWSSVVGVAGAVVTALAPGETVALLGIALLGIGIAVIVPSANSILGKMVSDEGRSFAISRAWLVGFSGMFIGPSIMGVIAEHFGLRVVFITIAVVLATVIPLMALLKRQT